MVVGPSWTYEQDVLSSVFGIHAVDAVTVFGPISLQQVALGAALSGKCLGEMDREAEFWLR